MEIAPERYVVPVNIVGSCARPDAMGQNRPINMCTTKPRLSFLPIQNSPSS